MEVEVRESEIEDVFAQYPELLKRVLGISEDIYLLARQKPLPSGRLDLVYSCMSNLLLIELKAEQFNKTFLRQVLSYRDEISSLQQRGKFVIGDVMPYLVCTDFSKEAKELADSQGIHLCSYDPADVLSQFYRNAPLDTKYLSVLPTDKGVWRIGLSAESVVLVEKLSQIHLIARAKTCSTKTAGNQLRLAEELGLVYFSGRQVELSSFGKEFIKRVDPLLPTDALSVEQANQL